MAQLTLFPLQYKRQDSVPIDVDSVFHTAQERVDYLSNPRRYAGQIVTDNELESVFILNNTRDAWVPIGSLSDFIWSNTKTYIKGQIVVVETTPGVFQLYISKSTTVGDNPVVSSGEWFLLETGGGLTPQFIEDLPLLDTVQDLEGSSLEQYEPYRTSSGFIKYRTTEP